MQGEGGQAGRVSVFCRFAGCNCGLEERKTDRKASCRFCDTDFVGLNGNLGGKYTAQELADLLWNVWCEGTDGSGVPYIVFTGGEPLLQLDTSLIQECKERYGFEIAVETNGTQHPPDGIDWLCVSPKPRSEQVLQSGNEIKLIYPQPESEMTPENFVHQQFEHFYLQPMDGPEQAENIQKRSNIAYDIQNGNSVYKRTRLQVLSDTKILSYD